MTNSVKIWLSVAVIAYIAYLMTSTLAMNYRFDKVMTELKHIEAQLYDIKSEE